MLPSSALSTAISLPLASPLSPPWYPGGPRAEGLAIAAWEIEVVSDTNNTSKTEKHLWLDSL